MAVQLMFCGVDLRNVALLLCLFLYGSKALLVFYVAFDRPLYWLVDVMEAAMKISAHAQNYVSKFMDSRLRFSDRLFQAH